MLIYWTSKNMWKQGIIEKKRAYRKKTLWILGIPVFTMKIDLF